MRCLQLIELIIILDAISLELLIYIMLDRLLFV